MNSMHHFILIFFSCKKKSMQLLRHNGTNGCVKDTLGYNADFN